MTPTTTQLFVWDRNHDNNEQVRPYMNQFLDAHREITADGGFPYNDSFKNRIVGIAGSADEDRAIYMLQQLKSLDELAVQIAEYKAAGGIDIENLEEGTVYRGSVVRYGYYVGGTGFTRYDSVRFAIKFRETRNGQTAYLHVWKPRKRNPIELNGNLLVTVAGN